MLGKKKTSATKASEAAASSAAARLATELASSKQQSNGGASTSAEVPDEEKTVEQLVAKAQNVHGDSTKTAQAALRKVEEMKEMKNNTLTELDQQNKKLEKIDDSMHQLNENLSYSEKILLYMRMCCCCWMFDSCTGADPEDQREQQWQREVRKGKTAQAGARYSPPDAKSGSPSTRSPAQGASSSNSPHAGPQYRGPDTNLPAGHERQALKLTAETRKQDQIIDQIGQGLDEILDGAKAIHEELGRQDKLVDHIVDRAEKNHVGLKELNNKSQLRDFRIPDKSSSDETMGATAIKLLTKI